MEWLAPPLGGRLRFQGRLLRQESGVAQTAQLNDVLLSFCSTGNGHTFHALAIHGLQDEGEAGIDGTGEAKDHARPLSFQRSHVDDIYRGEDTFYLEECADHWSGKVEGPGLAPGVAVSRPLLMHSKSGAGNAIWRRNRRHLLGPLWRAALALDSDEFLLGFKDGCDAREELLGGPGLADEGVDAEIGGDQLFGFAETSAG